MTQITEKLYTRGYSLLHRERNQVKISKGARCMGRSLGESRDKCPCVFSHGGQKHVKYCQSEKSPESCQVPECLHENLALSWLDRSPQRKNGTPEERPQQHKSTLNQVDCSKGSELISQESAEGQSQRQDFLGNVRDFTNSTSAGLTPSCGLLEMQDGAGISQVYTGASR